MAERIGTVYIGGARHYIVPETGVKAPGVTSILNMLPKPFLSPWAAKLAAEYAVDNLTAVADIASRDRQAAVDLIKGAPKRSTAGSAGFGTEVHDYLEAKVLGHDLPKMSARATEFIPAIDRWFDKWQPEAVLTEASVYGECEAGPYAGSFDGVLRLCGENVLVDWKTGNSVHEEVSIQLACYRFATGIIGAGVPGLPEIDAAAVIHVRPDVVKLYPVSASPDKLDVFSSLYHVWQWEQSKKGALGRPMAEPPTGPSASGPAKEIS